MSLEQPAVKIGPWGGPGGDAFDFRGNVIGARVTSGEFVNSIEFRLADGRTVKIGGANGEGPNVHEANFLTGRYLRSISGTISKASGHYLTSITFHTNLPHGPFGTPGDSTPFWVPVELGSVTGIFGRQGWYVDAIGFYLTPPAA